MRGSYVSRLKGMTLCAKAMLQICVPCARMHRTDFEGEITVKLCRMTMEKLQPSARNRLFIALATSTVECAFLTRLLLRLFLKTGIISQSSGMFFRRSLIFTPYKPMRIGLILVSQSGWRMHENTPKTETFNES